MSKAGEHKIAGKATTRVSIKLHLIFSARPAVCRQKITFETASRFLKRLPEWDFTDSASAASPASATLHFRPGQWALSVQPW